MLTVIILSITLTACGCSSKVYKEFKLTGIKSEKLAEPFAAQKLVVSDYSNEDYKSLISSINSFCAEFTYAFIGDKNYAVSPASVFMALSLAAECANGNTQTELLNALGVDYSILSSTFTKLYADLNRVYTIKDAMGVERLQGVIRTGNSLWITKNATTKQNCLDTLSQKYHTWVFGTDFYSKNEQANADISSFVKQFTNGQIDVNYNFDTETLFVLMNALYLKDTWHKDGDKLSSVGNYSFVNFDGSKSNKTLYGGYYFGGRAYEEEKFSSFYTTTDKGFKLKFILPNDGYTLKEVFTPENIAKINSITDYNSVDDENQAIHLTRCVFPEFDLDFDGDIISVLENTFGVKDLFSRSNCDFSNLTNEPVYASMVRHNTKLIVDKVGIEGSAVTTIAMAGSAAPPEYVRVYHDFVVDKAFGFVLSTASGVPLFSGMVNKL